MRKDIQAASNNGLMKGMKMTGRMMKGLIVLLCMVVLLFVTVMAGKNKDNPVKDKDHPIKTGAGQMQESEPVKIFAQMGHHSSPQILAISPDGQSIVSGGPIENSLKLWNVSDGRLLASLRQSTVDMGFDSVAFSPDGHKIVSIGGPSGIINIWDSLTGQEIKAFSNKHKPSAARFSADSSNIFSLETGYINENAGSGKELRKFFISDDTLNPDETRDKRKYKRHLPHSRDNEVFAVSPNGLYLAVCDISKLAIRDVTSGGSKELRTADTETIYVLAESETILSNDIQADFIAFFPDGNTLVTGSTVDPFGNKDLTIRLWDVSRKKLIRSIPVKGEVDPEKAASFALSSDGHTVAAVGGNGIIYLFDTASGKEINSFQISNQSVVRIVLSPDGHTIISADFDGNLRSWDSSSGKKLVEFTGNSVAVTSIAISPDERFIAQAGEDTVIRLKETMSGEEIRSFKGHSNDVYALTFSSDGRTIVSGSGDKSVRIWDTASGSEIQKLMGHREGIGFVSISPDGQTIASGSYIDGTINFWDRSSGQISKTFNNWFGSSLLYKVGTGVQFLQDGRGIVTGVFNSPDVLEVVDYPSGKVLHSFKFKGGVGQVAVSNDMHHIAIDELEPAIRNMDTGKVEFVVHKKGVEEIACSSPGLKFSPDNRMVAKVCMSGTITIYDLASGLKLMTLDGYHSYDGELVFSKDSKHLFSPGTDGSVRKWDLATGMEIAQFVSFKDGEWVTITPEGYYDASKNGDKHLNVRVGNKVFGIENYREKFYRPDLVQMALAGQALPAELAGGISKVGVAPAVSLINLPSKVESDTLDVQVKVKDQGGGIGDVRVYINGTAVQGKASRALKLIKDGVDAGNTLSIPVNLVSGENKIKVLVFNAENSMSSNPAEANVTASFKVQRKPQLHALIVGIQEFDNPSLNLQFTKGDAESIKQALEKQAAGLFDKVNIQLLTSKADTSKSFIEAAFAKFKDNVAPDDVFLFYVASHGTVDGDNLADKSYYLITSNVGSTATKYLKQNAISQDGLRRLIADIPATKKLVLLDTCHAGDVGSKLLGRGLDEDSAVKLLSRSTGIAVIAASTSTQQALEGHHGHGVFTYVLLEGLAGKADAAKKGYVTPVSLADYVTEQVPDVTEKIFKSKQYPTFNVEGQPFPIVRSN